MVQALEVQGRDMETERQTWAEADRCRMAREEQAVAAVAQLEKQKAQVEQRLCTLTESAGKHSHGIAPVLVGLMG